MRKVYRKILEKHQKGKCCKCSYCCEPCYNEEKSRELLNEKEQNND